MLEAMERHNQAIALARMLKRPYSAIKFANNGQFELAFTHSYGQ
jgi:hypothetical protein